MDNQHRKIEGYRELSQEEINLINRIKIHGAKTEQLIKDVKDHLIKQHKEAHEVEDTETLMRYVSANPLRFIELSHDTFQTALMQLTRAVAQPTNF